MRTSEKASRFTESVIREMTRLAHQHQAVNLSQGFPDFPAPAEVKAAAVDAINNDINQYAVTWGAKPLRDAIAHDMTARYGVPVDADAHVTVLTRDGDPAGFGSTPVTVQELARLLAGEPAVELFEPLDTGVWIRLRGDTTCAIDQQYLP